MNWGWLLALGIIQLVFGIVGLVMAVTLTFATILIYGILLFVAGGAQIVHSFAAKGWRSILLHIAIAGSYVIIGLVIIYNPLLASLAVTIAIGFLFTITGIIRGIMAFQMKNSKNRGWYLLSAAVSIILGLIIVTQWPISALWVIGLFVAVELIFNGWASIMLAITAHDLSKAEMNPQV